jgi:murein L,D-transpeptidase YafK
MKVPYKFKYFLALFCIFSILFFLYGRSLWYPSYLRIAGTRTSAKVYKEIGKKVEGELKQRFAAVNIPYPPDHLTLIALKEERMLEIWADEKNRAPVLIDTYPFTAFSGKLGPKLKSGDGQIPEGLYTVEYLNPNSSFHLSMKLSYPNDFDKKMAKGDGRSNLGGDIFIHGKSVSIGCIPIGDRNIERLFILAYVEGIDNIDVIIAPYDMREKKRPFNSTIQWLGQKYQRIDKEISRYQKNHSGERVLRKQKRLTDNDT